MKSRISAENSIGKTITAVKDQSPYLAIHVGDNEFFVAKADITYPYQDEHTEAVMDISDEISLQYVDPYDRCELGIITEEEQLEEERIIDERAKAEQEDELQKLVRQRNELNGRIAYLEDQKNHPEEYR